MTVDLIILGVYLVLVLGNGLFASRNVKTLRDYSLGGRHYSSFCVFATLSAAFIGGGFTTGLAESTFSIGLVYVVALWGFSLKEILVALIIAPRMVAFRNALSVGDIMGQLYGTRAKIFTGLAACLVSAGIAGAQFTAFGSLLEVLAGIPAQTGSILGALIVITYATVGGMRSVVANDVFHFCVLIVTLPLVLILGLQYAGGIATVLSTVPETHTSFLGKFSYPAAFTLFLSFFFGETLVPPYVQRLLIGKNIQNTIRGTFWSGILSIPFFLMIGMIGLIAYTIDPAIHANLALPYVIQVAMPVGLKGLAIAGMIAVVMSSADAFLNAAAVAVSHDVIAPLRRRALNPRKELYVTRMMTFAVGTGGVFFSLGFTHALDILLAAYNFWTPFVLVPLVAGIMGYSASARTFWTSSLAGITTVIGWNLFAPSMGGAFDGAIAGIIANAVLFILLRRMDALPVSVAESPSQEAKQTGTYG